VKKDEQGISGIRAAAFIWGRVALVVTSFSDFFGFDLMLILAVLISFTAMSVLCLEVVWMRLFAIESFSSFGYMILSIALLGFGIGGIVITMFSRRLAAGRERWLYRFSLAFPLAVVVSILFSKIVPFVPQNIIQDPAQLGYIALLYLFLSLPFVAGSLTIGLILTTAGDKVGKLYFADLVGSGLGGVAVLAAFYLVHPDALPVLVVVLFLPALAAAGIGAGSKGRYMRLAVSAAVAAGSILALVIFGGVNFSEYKGISYAMAAADVTEAEVVEEAFGPLGFIQVVSSTSERTAAGLSTEAPLEALPPVQKGLYVDGSKVASVARELSEEEQTYMDWQLTSIPYGLKKDPDVLLVGLGGGEGVARALHCGAGNVEVAEVNSVLVNLVKERFSDENGGLLKRGDVRVNLADGRDFAARNPGAFDIVFLSFFDASGLSQPGSKSHLENYLFTTQSLTGFLEALKDEGVLVVSTRVEEPPRGALRLVPSVLAPAFELWGREQTANSVAYLRSQFHGILLLKKGGFVGHEIDFLLEESWMKGFDASFYPGMQREVLEQKAEEEEAFWAEFKEKEGVDLSAFDSDSPVQDPFFDCISAILNDEDRGASYLAAYPFEIAPAGDDRPYLSAMLKSGSLDFIRKNAYDPDHWEREVPPDLWAEPVVLATLLQALLFASLILLLPLLAGRKRLPKRGKLNAFVYFSCLAMGFMFVEMVLIQKFTLYVAAPAYAAAVVLSGMLVFSGLGAAFSSRFANSTKKGIVLAVAAIVTLSGVYNLCLTPLLLSSISLSEPLKVGLSLMTIAPVAFFLGMPFPLGLTAVSQSGQTSLPAWGWAVNGAVSVVGIVLAQALAMQFGFTVVFWLVAGIYLLALFTFPERQARSTRD